MVIVNPNKEDAQKLLEEIRSKSNPRETKTVTESRYGHKLATIHYYKDNIDIARIFKTDGVIDEVNIYDTELPT